MIDLVPLKLFSQRISEGWQMVPGYDLKARDWAVTMRSPDHFEPVKSNVSRAAGSARGRPRKYPLPDAPALDRRSSGVPV